MKLNQVPNLRVEDFQSEQTWIGRLFVQLNPFIQSVNQVLSQNIDFFTNIKSVTKSYTITSFQSFSFQWPYTDYQPVSLLVVKATKGTLQTPTILQAAWSYNSTTQVITVTRMVEVLDTSVAALSGSYTFSVRATV